VVVLRWCPALCLGPVWTAVLLLVLPFIAGDNRCHHAQSLVGMGSCKLFAQAGLELRSSQSLPPKCLQFKV
jgi:hypothetical protein